MANSFFMFTFNRSAQILLILTYCAIGIEPRTIPKGGYSEKSNFINYIERQPSAEYVNFAMYNSVYGQVKSNNRGILFAKGSPCHVPGSFYKVCSYNISKSEVRIDSPEHSKCFDGNGTTVTIYFSMKYTSDYCCGSDVCNNNPYWIALIGLIVLSICVVLSILIYLQAHRTAKRAQVVLDINTVDYNLSMFNGHSTLQEQSQHETFPPMEHPERDFYQSSMDLPPDDYDQQMAEAHAFPEAHTLSEAQRVDYHQSRSHF